MRRNALVVGAQTGELSGVHNDVETMIAILTGRGFAVDRRVDGDATQAGIRDGYLQLISGAQDGDAVVVYFSGHGNVAQAVTPDGARLPERRFIVPTDYAESSPGDFRGITAIELSVLLARLTERTPNAVVMLDCCHAARMARNDGLLVKAWPHPSYVDIVEHTGMLRALGLDDDVVDPIANRHAVRLVACAPWESAFEYTNRHGVRTGMLTDSFRVAVEEAGGARITWSTLIQRVRSRVSTLAPGQRPEVEGPSRRMLFELEGARRGATLPVVASRPDRVTLPGAGLLGAAPGDEFAITPAGTAVVTESTIVARATVTRTDGVTLVAEVRLCDGQDRLPKLAEAHPLTTSIARGTVLVRGDGPLAERTRAEIDAIATLMAVGPQDPVGDDPFLAEVVAADELSLWDGGQTPLTVASPDLSGVDRIVTDLGSMSRAAVLRRLRPGPGEALTDRFTVDWGRVVDRAAQALPPTGARLHVGESIYVRLRNESDRSLYFFVFDLSVAHAVNLVTADPSGLRLTPGEEVIVGERANGVLVGSPLTWPAGLVGDGPRPETLLVVVTVAPHDLSVLTEEAAGPTPQDVPPPDEAVAGTATRDWAVGNTSGPGYAVVRLDFDLIPDTTPVRERATFLIDERPDPSVRLLVTRASTAGTSAHRTVAVRLSDLVVHRNRALGGADVRVDALVLSGGRGDVPVYRAGTARFSRIRDGDRLPLDDMLVYHGPAVDYLDLAWWVSRDRRGSRALSDMLRDRLTDDNVLQAIGSLSALAIGSPHAALAVTAVSACAVIVNTAYELLSQAVGDSIGLYRTSLLASSGFGIGRHPVQGLHTAQDFAFAYEVVDA